MLSFNQRANSAASVGCLLCVVTASVEPPQLADAWAPAVHCGSGAARHFPVVLAAWPLRKTGPHPAVTQEAIDPLESAVYHAVLKSPVFVSRPAFIMSPQ